MEAVFMKSLVVKKAIWGFGASVVLSLCYFLSRHDVLGGWHGMIDWPLLLFTFGLVAILIAAFTFSTKVMICVPAGYLFGSFAAWLFNTDRIDLGGGRLNDSWMIWTVLFIIFLLAGVVWEIICICKHED